MAAYLRSYSGLGQMPATMVRKASQEGDDEADCIPAKSLRDGFSILVPHRIQKATKAGGHQCGYVDYVPSHDCLSEGCGRVVINVSGQRFETQVKTLNRFPGTVLGDASKRQAYWDARKQEYFFDRHRPSFQAILYYYQSGGRLKRPFEVPADVFLSELEFYEIDERAVKTYKEKEGYILEKPLTLPSRHWQKELWTFCEEPGSSHAARVFAIVSVGCIVVTVVNFCLETIPELKPESCIEVQIQGPVTVNSANGTSTAATWVTKLVPDFTEPFFVMESVCVLWFTVELLLRLASCPSKWAFCRDVMNIFDALAVMPYYVSLPFLVAGTSCTQGGGGGAAGKADMLLIVRALRVVRIFKLSKHSRGLQILGKTIRASMSELATFFFFLIIAMVIFSSAMYFAEQGDHRTQMTSIPDAFWWAIVTMTTVGYGDITPVSLWGKLVGAVCVIAGDLTIALPMPVIVENFNNFYRRETGRGYLAA